MDTNASKPANPKPRRRTALFFVRFICALIAMASGMEFISAQNGLAAAIPFVWFLTTLGCLFFRPKIGILMMGFALIANFVKTLSGTANGPSLLGSFVGVAIMLLILVAALKDLKSAAPKDVSEAQGRAA
jgi:hypothetical protein